MKRHTLTGTRMEVMVPDNIANYVKSYGEILQSELYHPELRLSDLEGLLLKSFDMYFVSSVPGMVTPGATALAFGADAGSFVGRSFDPLVNTEHFTVVSPSACLLSSHDT